MKFINTLLFLLSVAIPSSVVAQYPPCNVCGGDLVVTNPSAIAYIPGQTNTPCFELAGVGGGGGISPYECANLPGQIGQTCGCAPPTQEPTQSPSYPTCNICAPNQLMSSPDTWMSYTDSSGTTNMPCSNWQAEGAIGQIPPNECASLQNQNLPGSNGPCGCQNKLYRGLRD